jgi:predicted RNA binding protein YcfA (HicA-like mRNA interferase family)
MKLPVLSWKQVAKILVKSGYRPSRQRGNHINFVKDGCRTVTVQKTKELSPGNLMSIIRQTGLDKDELLRKTK